MADNLFESFTPKKVDCVSTVVSLTRSSFSQRVYFRGHADGGHWQLIPTIARMKYQSHAGKNIPVPNIKQQEWALLHRFRRHTYEQRGRILNKWESLFLARHHNLPVRLLDWTTNPLVALYFAALHEGSATEDGAIWFFERRNRRHDIDVFEQQDPFRIRGVRLIYPFYPTQRMTAQSGLFTIHSLPWKDLRFLKRNDLPTNDIDIVRGGRWTVPKNVKGNLLEELDRLGINARTLFPELDGLARGLIHTEAFRTADQYPSR